MRREVVAVGGDRLLRAKCDLSTVAGVLRYMRLCQGMSQEQLAAESGVERASISRLEGGYRAPTLDTLRALCAACGRSLGWLFSLVDEHLERRTGGTGRGQKKA